MTTLFKDNLPEKVEMLELLLRDGLQHADTAIQTEAKLWYAEYFLRAGFKKIEVTNFGHPKLLTQSRDAEEILEKVHKLNISGFELQTSMLTDSAYEGQTKVRSDSTSLNGLPSIAHYIEKILLVSDNDAYNRLYEFLGQSTIFDRLTELGYTETRIIHRLSILLPQELNRCTNPVRFYNGEKLVYEQPLVCNDSLIKPIRSVGLGKGYMNGDLLVHEPMDFTYKNSLPLEDLHTMLKSIIFPEEASVGTRFALEEEDYRFLYKFMSMYPRESGIPGYDKYEDGYCKFFIFGGEVLRDFSIALILGIFIGTFR